METKDFGRWALYGDPYMDLQKLQGCPLQEDELQECWWQEVALSTVMEVSWDRFPSCGNCSRALTSMCTWLLR